MERWHNEIEVDKVFTSLENALREKQRQNQNLKVQYGSKYYLTKRKAYLKLLQQYEQEIVKYEKLETLVLEKQKNLKLTNTCRTL